MIPTRLIVWEGLEMKIINRLLLIFTFAAVAVLVVDGIIGRIIS
jgi:hypothetical protein